MMHEPMARYSTSRYVNGPSPWEIDADPRAGDIPQVLGAHHQLCPTLEAEANLCGEPPECRAPNLRGEVRTESGEDVMAQAVSTPKLMQVAVKDLMFHRSEAARQDVVVRVPLKAMVPLK
jgi:hypothetical protein